MASVRHYISKRRLKFSKPESVCTTLRCDDEQKLDFLKLDNVRTRLRRKIPALFRMHDISKQEGVRTTLRRVVEKTLYFLKPDDIRTTLRCVDKQTLYYSKPDGVCTTLHRDHDRSLECSKPDCAFSFYTLFTITILRNQTTSLQHYVASTNGRSTIQNWMASVRHYISTSIHNSNFRNQKRLYDTTPQRRIVRRSTFKTRRRLYDTIPRRRTDA